MVLNEKIEDIILKANMITHMDIMVTDDEKVIYYIGDTDKCKKYIYSEVSEELKALMNIRLNEIKYCEEDEIVPIIDDKNEKFINQAIYGVYEKEKFDKFIIFNRTDREFNDNDKFIISSTIYLIEKYLSDKE